MTTRSVLKAPYPQKGKRVYRRVSESKRERIIRDYKRGDLTNQAIADKHDISVWNVYKIVKAAGVPTRVSQTTIRSVKRLIEKGGTALEAMNLADGKSGSHRRRFAVTLLKAQKNKCKLCDKPITLEDCHVDHCHAKGHIRAALCRQCNMGLGCFKDSPKLFRKAIAYLKEHKYPNL